MITPVETKPATDLELVLAFLVDATPEALFRCWTEPALLVQWFAPKPLTTEVRRMDVRPGGASDLVMKDPSGAEYPAAGVYLEIVPNARLVFTDAFKPGWIPTGQPFFCGEITFAPQGDKTLYTARARHWTVESKQQHEAMGFAQGWTQCAGQLAELAATL